MTVILWPLNAMLTSETEIPLPTTPYPQTFVKRMKSFCAFELKHSVKRNTTT